MRVSLRWLREFCSFPDEDTLIQDFNRIGFEVESVEKKGEGLCHIVIGQIHSFKPHPNADRLRIADVFIGESCVQIVTAATNVQDGDKVPISLPGAVLANGMTIKASQLRGVDSQGMMCSAVECGLTDTSPGVWVLPPDAPVGEDFIAYAHLVDTIIDVAILPNRGDAMSLYGLAREVSALYAMPMTFSVPQSTVSDTVTPVVCSVDDTHDCEYYRAQRVTGLVPGYTTPVVWQTRLYYTGQRPVSWPIDVTNIVMIETGQPLHAFDAHTIETIHVGRGHHGAMVTLLNDKSVQLTSDVLVVHVNNTPAAVAGIMGTTEYSVSETTSAIILEAGIMNPVLVRKAAKQLGVRSESSSRFEKGVDPHGIDMASRRAIQLLSESGARITCDQPIVVGHYSSEPQNISLDIAKMNIFLGTNYTLSNVAEQLAPLGFQLNKTTVTVPSWRKNDCQEWPDIAEEMCRFSGIDDISSTPIRTMVPVHHDSLWQLRKKIIESATTLGFTEAIPFPLSPTDILDSQPKVLNPITPELTTLRSNGIQSLIQVAALNVARHPHPVRMISVGPVWDSQGNETWQCSSIIQGTAHYQPYLKKDTGAIDFYDVKGCVDSLFLALGIQHTIQPCTVSHWVHPGQSADIYIDDVHVGFFGMIHPEVKAAHRLPDTGIIEWSINALLTHNISKHYPMVSKFPATTRDTTYIIDTRVSVGEVLAILNNKKPSLCTRIILCGYYEQPDQTAVNVSFRMTYQDHAGSLEMDEVNTIHKALAESVIHGLPCRFPE
ncbi:MAG: phenylalanine--tRNA ligase subunit beta [Candidatus Marinamargulisbacteria bacterium]